MVTRHNILLSLSLSIYRMIFISNLLPKLKISLATNILNDDFQIGGWGYAFVVWEALKVSLAYLKAYFNIHALEGCLLIVSSYQPSV